MRRAVTPVWVEGTNRSYSQPPPFPCRITPRVRKGSEEGSEVRF